MARHCPQLEPRVRGAEPLTGELLVLLRLCRMMPTVIRTDAMVRRLPVTWLVLSSLMAAGMPVWAQSVEGRNIPGFHETFGIPKDEAQITFRALLIGSSAPANVLWPGEQPTLRIQFVNKTDQPISAVGEIAVIAYGTKGRPGDIWVPHMLRIAQVGSTPVQVELRPRGYTNLDVTLQIPDRFGAYGIVADLGPAGREFVASMVRTFRPDPRPVQYPQFCTDVTDIEVLTRLGVAPNRFGIGYKPTTNHDFEEYFQHIYRETIKPLHEARLAVTCEIGGGAYYGPEQPLGRARPWLDENGVMLDTKFDLAWLPSYDADFRKFCKRIVSEWGWPKGPVTAIKLWNEPWNGLSISGWGADDLRYREMFLVLCEATREACQEAGTEVLIGGCDSSSNTFDKLFGDGQETFLPYLDFCSIHYHGMACPSTYKPWVNRRGPYGRVRIWDTESWVANCDDRVATVIATNLSTGHDRAVGVYHGAIATGGHYWETFDYYDDDGQVQRLNMVQCWSVAAAVGAVNHFIGERRFRELLFKNGLPWIMVFDGLPGPGGEPNPEDGTVVVIGDIGEAFGADNVLFRTARGLKERAHEAELAAQLAALPPDAPEDDRRKLRDLMAQQEPLSGASLTLPPDDAYALYDFYGNRVEAGPQAIVVPLDHRGFFLRGNGQPGSFARLLRVLRTARVEGIEPLAKACPDLTAPIASRPWLRLRLTNVLNRPIRGVLRVKLGELTLAQPTRELTFEANQTREVAFQVVGGAPAESNSYPLTLEFDAGADGRSTHQEDLHVNFISRRTVNVDGNLDDWEGVLPQTITSEGVQRPTVQELAWQPFKSFDQSVKQGAATGFLAYDDQYFYFAAKIADTTPDEGMLRFETRDEEQFFYPDKCYERQQVGGTVGQNFSVRWSGFVLPRHTGRHTFTTLSDDGVRLWVDGQKLIDNWTMHGPTEDTGVIQLEAGQAYPIQLEYMQGGGGACIRLLWEAPGQTKEVVPADCLRPTREGGQGLKGEYFHGTHFDLKSSDRIDPQVDFAAFAAETLKGVLPEGPKEILRELTWPAGVRHYTYRKDPELPAGNSPHHDNVQLAFNVLPPERKEWYPCPPGTMPGYTSSDDTDYEYALNPVAPRYGGGTELWRLQYPGMPHKHHYPHSPKSPLDGPVRDGKLVICRDATTRFVEAALPWTEMPEVRRAIDERRPIKFSFRVNDNAGVGCLELSRGRSVAKRNGLGSFTVDWVEHWDNALEFGVERAEP